MNHPMGEPQTFRALHWSQIVVDLREAPTDDMLVCKLDKTREQWEQAQRASGMSDSA